MEESVAEENHLKPFITQGPSFSLSVDRDSGPEDDSGEYVASVSVCETSEQPARSAIHCPVVQAIVTGREAVECRSEEG
jgi:hypothetical protein